MNTDIVRARIIVTGSVQGIGFRFFAHTHAARLGISGYARNQVQGALEIEAQGERTAIDQLIDHIRTGPDGAVVEDVKIDWIAPVAGERGFGTN